MLPLLSMPRPNPPGGGLGTTAPLENFGIYLYGKYVISWPFIIRPDLNHPTVVGVCFWGLPLISGSFKVI